MPRGNTASGVHENPKTTIDIFIRTAGKENFTSGEWKPIGTTVPKLEGEYFLVTGSGKYFRNVTVKPEDSFCIIELDSKGENDWIC